MIRPNVAPRPCYFACTLLIVLNATAWRPARVDADQDIILDGRAAGRTFDGIGETCAGGGVGRLLINYPEPQRGEVLDYLFKPNYGASLHVLKVEIGGDGNSTEGSEPSHMHTPDDLSFQRGYTWWLLKEAKKRNPDLQIHALAWDWPGWIKDINSDDAVNYLVAYIQGAKREHGITIDFIGGWNETPFDYSFFKRLRKGLDAAGLKTKIAAADQVQHWDIVDKAAKDPELFFSIDVFGSHYVRYQSTLQARGIGKPLWSQEDGPWNDNWAADGAMGGAYPKILNRNYIDGRITSTQLWCLVSAYYDILDVPNAGLMRAMTPWSGHYEVRTPIWMVAHTTQFAHPGWRYLDSACMLLENGGSIVALAHDGDFSVIVETLDASEPQTLNFSIGNELKDGPIHVWHTNDRETFVHAESIRPVNRSFPLTLQPRALYSMTTTTGQAKGTAQPPSDAPFPMPYHDAFDDGTIGTTTGRYYIEQNGSYEFVATPERDGRCLRQVVSQTPLVWPFGPEANTMGTLCIIGDKLWANYEVEIDTRLEEPGYARVAGRIARAQLNGTVSGYQLYVWDTGEWRLVTRTWTDGASGVLAEGKTSIGLNQWHNLKLRFLDHTVSASLDGRELATVEDEHFHRGMAGFGNGWNRGCYDNLRMTPIANAELMARTDRTSAALPFAPKIKTAVPQSQAVQLEWDVVPGAEGYKVLYGTEPDKLTSVADAGVATNYRCWTLSNGTTYYFAVAAYNFNGDGPPSKSVSATPRGKQRE